MESQVERGVEMVAILLGWPAVAASVICFTAAVFRRSRQLAIAGCCLALPMFLYLAMTPGFRYLAPPGLIGLGLAAWRIREAHWLITVALIAPAVGQILVLAWAVVGRAPTP